MSTDYTIYRTTMTQAECNEAMRYPYMFVRANEDTFNSGFEVEFIRKPILVDETEAEAGNFPDNIKEHFWVREGQKDEDSWMACGQLTNGAYFFYTGSCDYTGFDCMGGMSLWISNSWKNIVDHAYSKWHDLYLKQTAVPVNNN